VLNRNLICTNTAEFSEAQCVTFLNPYSFLELYHSDVDLKQFDKICIDGVALKIFLNFAFRGAEIQRLSFDFTSVANLVFNTAAAGSQRGFILGSDQSSNDKFLSKITSMFPGIKLDGRSGYFDDDEDLANSLQSLSESDYDFVVIGMGAVKQEQTAIKLKNAGYLGRIYTCGTN